MKRDMDLIRNLLFVFESQEKDRLDRSDLALNGYEKKQIDFHLELMEEGGLIVHDVFQPKKADGHAFPIRFDMGRRPTMTGYDFLESVRDSKTWEKTKNGAMAAGGFTIDLLKDLAKGFIKMQIEERTGVKF